MSQWKIRSTVKFTHGKVEARHLTDKDFHALFLSARWFEERKNTGGPFHVPGHRVAINFDRPAYLHFSHGFGLWRQDRLCDAEIAILAVINEITEQSNWHADVNDFSVCQTWKSDAFARYPSNAILWEWCICELRKKAEQFRLAPHSIIVLDSASRVCKSDRLIGTRLLGKLIETTKDMRISPLLYPFTYGQTPIIGDGISITLENAGHRIGEGVFPSRPFWETVPMYAGEPCYYSNVSQWLATNIEFTGNGNDVRIISPINNLHPQRNSFIYTAVEKIVSESIHDWNQTLMYKTIARDPSRIKPQSKRCHSCSVVDGLPCSCRIEFRRYSAWAEGRDDNNERDAWSDTFWNPVSAMDGEYSSSRRLYDDISLREGFGNKDLQIYVEISRLELAAKNVVMAESKDLLEWNLSGNRNERIVASTVVCLERENLHPFSGGISFRTETKENTWEHVHKKQPKPEMPSTNRTPLRISRDDCLIQPSHQELGTVKLPQGRKVTFPNALQHKFEQPILDDDTCPGHMILLHIHLVDPHYAVCSTRYAPQQGFEYWWDAAGLRQLCIRHNVPELVKENIVDKAIAREPRPRARNGRPARRPRPYWRARGGVDWNPGPPPPLRLPSARQREQEALSTHRSIMKAVNGARIDTRTKAGVIWYRHFMGEEMPLEQSDPCDRLSRPSQPTAHERRQAGEETDVGTAGGTALGINPLEMPNTDTTSAQLPLNPPNRPRVATSCTGASFGEDTGRQSSHATSSKSAAAAVRLAYARSAAARPSYNTPSSSTSEGPYAEPSYSHELDAGPSGSGMSYMSLSNPMQSEPTVNSAPIQPDMESVFSSRPYPRPPGPRPPPSRSLDVAPSNDVPSGIASPAIASSSATKLPNTTAIPSKVGTSSNPTSASSSRDPPLLSRRRPAPMPSFDESAEAGPSNPSRAKRRRIVDPDSSDRYDTTPFLGPSNIDWPAVLTPEEEDDDVPYSGKGKGRAEVVRKYSQNDSDLGDASESSSVSDAAESGSDSDDARPGGTALDNTGAGHPSASHFGAGHSGAGDPGADDAHDNGSGDEQSSAYDSEEEEYEVGEEVKLEDWHHEEDEQSMPENSDDESDENPGLDNPTDMPKVPTEARQLTPSEDGEEQEYHDAVFYYFIGTNFSDEEEEPAEEEDTFYDASMTRETEDAATVRNTESSMQSGQTHEADLDSAMVESRQAEDGPMTDLVQQAQGMGGGAEPETSRGRRGLRSLKRKNYRIS